MKTRKYQIIIVLLIASTFSVFVIYNYINKEHRNIATERIDFKIAPNNLKTAMNTLSTSKQYVDKVIQTEGLITSIEQNSIIIEDKVLVNFIDTDIELLAPNIKLSIKGRCVGYDDLLELVKIDQATIVNQ